MGYYDLTREARFEFRRVAARSLLASARDELARHSDAGHRLRARRAERRVRQLERAFDGAPPSAGTPWAVRHANSVSSVATVIWLATVAAVPVVIAARGFGGAVAAADVAMLCATAAWFGAVLVRPSHPEWEDVVPSEGALEPDEPRSTWLSLTGYYSGGELRDGPDPAVGRMVRSLGFTGGAAATAEAILRRWNGADPFPHDELVAATGVSPDLEALAADLRAAGVSHDAIERLLDPHNRAP